MMKPLCVTIKQCSAMSGIGVNKLRQLAAEENCPFSLKVGTKTMIKVAQFEEWLKDVKSI